MRKDLFGNASWGFRELSLEEQLKITKEMGLHIHELGIANAEGDIPLNVTAAELDEVRACYQKYDMQLLCAATGNDFTVSNSEQKEMQEKIKRVIDICHELGVTYLRIFAGFAPVEKVTGSIWEQMIQSICNCAEYAKERQVTLCLETHGGVEGFEDGVEHFHSTSTEPGTLCQMLSQIPEQVKIVYDPANMYAVGIENQKKVYENMKDRIGYLHLKDFKRLRTGHLNPAACGEGNMQWDEIFPLLENMEVPMLFEYECPEDIERGSRQCLEFMISRGK